MTPAPPSRSRSKEARRERRSRETRPLLNALVKYGSRAMEVQNRHHPSGDTQHVSLLGTFRENCKLAFIHGIVPNFTSIALGCCLQLEAAASWTRNVPHQIEFRATARRSAASRTAAPSALPERRARLFWRGWSTGRRSYRPTIAARPHSRCPNGSAGLASSRRGRRTEP